MYIDLGDLNEKIFRNYIKRRSHDEIKMLRMMLCRKNVIKILSKRSGVDLKNVNIKKVIGDYYDV